MVKIRIHAFISLFILITSCSENTSSEEALKAKFTVKELGENTYQLKDTSTGSDGNTWLLGNGDVAKNQELVQVYYPKSGTYKVELTASSSQTNSLDSYSETINVASDDIIASFTVIKETKNNTYSFKNTSQGSYDSLEWDLGNGTKSTEESPTPVYYPFKGDYVVVLEIMKGNFTVSKQEVIKITEDDPDYISTMELVWSDEFEGDAVNSDDWTFEVGASGWGNQELQNYTNGSNASVSNGLLTITARKEGAGQNTGDYTSSRMITKDKQEFTYGRIEARMKLPGGKGTWPAFWMLGADISEVSWPACGEIDIMEHVGFDPTNVSAALHMPVSYGNTQYHKAYELPDCEDEFHVYGVIWSKDKIQFYIDTVANVYYEYAPSVKDNNNWPFNKDHFIIMNIAVGGAWGGQQGVDDTIFPQEMIIDYVRVYQLK